MQRQQMQTDNFPRDMVGYGKELPKIKWPNKAKVAIQFVLSYEEGGESDIPMDYETDTIILPSAPKDRTYEYVSESTRKSSYEYGSRVGIWRLIDLFNDFEIPITVFTVALALERNKPFADYLGKNDYDICSHGYCATNYQFVNRERENEHLYKAIEIITKHIGKRPIGWFTGKNSIHTRDIVMQEGGFLYDSDAYNDDLPYFIQNPYRDKKHLIIPYTLDVNDMRFVTAQGFNSGEQFYRYLKDTFDCLYNEGDRSPKMMSVGMHGRILGRPGRMMALKKFLDYVRDFDDVWFASRGDIARHWIKNYSIACKA